MTHYREILRLDHLGFNHTQAAASAGVSLPTVRKVLQAAVTQGITWEGAAELSDKELASRLFPDSAKSKPTFAMPDYAMVHREMQKDGVTLQLLWYEYADRCRTSGELPYQLTQFKKYYRDSPPQRASASGTPVDIANSCDDAHQPQTRRVDGGRLHPNESADSLGTPGLGRYDGKVG